MVDRVLTEMVSARVAEQSNSPVQMKMVFKPKFRISTLSPEPMVAPDLACSVQPKQLARATFQESQRPGFSYDAGSRACSTWLVSSTATTLDQMQHVPITHRRIASLPDGSNGAYGRVLTEPPVAQSADDSAALASTFHTESTTRERVQRIAKNLPQGRGP